MNINYKLPENTAVVDFLITSAEKELNNTVRDIDALDKKAYWVLTIVFALLGAQGFAADITVARALFMAGLLISAYFLLREIRPAGYYGSAFQVEDVVKSNSAARDDINELQKYLLYLYIDAIERNNCATREKGKAIKNALWALFASLFLYGASGPVKWLINIFC